MKKLLVLILFVLIYTTTVWAQEDVGSLISPGPLSKAHEKYEGITNCTKCHALGGGIPDSKCLDCHDKLAEKIKNKQGLHATFSQACIKCHSDHKGKAFKIITIDKGKFNHDDTGYLLKDKHLKVDCSKCHKKEGVYTGLSRDCISCHEDKHTGQLGKDCNRCHQFTGWKDIEKFSHNRDSKYAITGKHLDVKCEKCHPKNKYKIEKFEECITCHNDIHKGKPQCTECHTTEGWKKVKIDHAKTNYPLTNKHIQVSCEKCHKNNQLKGIPYKTCDSSACHSDPHKKQFPDKTCESCHTTAGWKPSQFNHKAPEYVGFKLDGKHLDTACDKCHVQGKFKPLNYKTCDTSDCHKDTHKGQFKGKTCESCHNVKGWKPALFNHNAPEYVGFNLDGKHTDVKCDKCHIEGKFKPINYKTCDTSDCHKDTHKGQFKGKTCESCHTTKTWKPSQFNHNALEYVGFKLDGKHTDVKCDKCHIEGKFKPINYKTCDTSDCHKDTHKGQFKGKTCESCHTTKTWKPALFNHNAPEYAGFKLTGKHIKTACEKCHELGKYKPIAANCFNCHEKDDVHKKELGNTCDKCHNTEEWKKATFNHNLQSKFPLIARHSETKCEKCHQEKKYKIGKEKCIDCHEDIHKGSFKEECTSCHTQTDWLPRRFDHKGKTGFELRGVHNDILCISCHKTKGEYKKVNRYCNQCHVDPHFNQFGSITCTQCHSENTWNPTQFNHSKTGYPLVGGHRTAECKDCHRDRVYRNVGSACVNCHLSKYTSAANHVAKGYNQDCTACHNVSFAAWTFNHSKASGGASCASCHSSNAPASHTTNNWTTCENCHRYPTWTFTHPSGGTGCGASGCHLTYSTPTRSANHSTNGWTSCENCHRYPTWSFSHSGVSSSCNSCHSSNYPSAHSTYNSRFGTSCENCHRYPSWTTTTFNHSFTSFPTSHKGYSACSNCHPSQNYGNKGGCIECHNSVGAETHHTNQNSGCLSCHPTGKD